MARERQFKTRGTLLCEVSSDGVPCGREAVFMLVIPEGSRLYQGQEPSPRCEGHGEQARQVFTEALATCELVPIERGGEE